MTIKRAIVVIEGAAVALRSFGVTADAELIRHLKEVKELLERLGTRDLAEAITDAVFTTLKDKNMVVELHNGVNGTYYVRSFIGTGLTRWSDTVGAVMRVLHDQ